MAAAFSLAFTAIPLFKIPFWISCELFEIPDICLWQRAQTFYAQSSLRSPKHFSLAASQTTNPNLKGLLSPLFLKVTYEIECMLNE